jgi:hypothetical protein
MLNETLDNGDNFYLGDAYNNDNNKSFQQQNPLYLRNNSSSNSTDSMSSSDRSDTGNRARIGRIKYNSNANKSGFTAYQPIEKPTIPTKIPDIIKNDPDAMKVLRKLKDIIDSNTLRENIFFTRGELQKISEYPFLANISDSYHKYVILQNENSTFGGKFKKSKRKYKYNKYKSRKGGKYRKTRKGGFGSTFTKGGKGGKSKNKKTRKH